MYGYLGFLFFALLVVVAVGVGRTILASTVGRQLFYVTCIAGGLLILAYAHIRQMTDVALYASSPLVLLELCFMLYALVTLVVFFIATGREVLARRYARAAGCAVGSFILLVLVVAATRIDAPTFIYAT